MGKRAIRMASEMQPGISGMDASGMQRAANGEVTATEHNNNRPARNDAEKGAVKAAASNGAAGARKEGAAEKARRNGKWNGSAMEWNGQWSGMDEVDGTNEWRKRKGAFRKNFQKP